MSFITSIPKVTTDRLILRGHTLRDWGPCTDLWQDPIVIKHISGTPERRSKAWNKIMSMTGHWAFMGYGYWAVEERETGRFVGQVGLSDFKRDVEPSIEGVPEAGWVLKPEIHGRGYGTEAVKAALHWYEGKFGPTRTVCMIAPDNTASLRLAEKCGYHVYVETVYEGNPSLLLERRSSAEAPRK